MGRSGQVWGIFRVFAIFGVTGLTACSDDRAETESQGLTSWGTGQSSADGGAADDDDDDDGADAGDDGDGGTGDVDYDVGNGDDDDDDALPEPSCEASDDIVVVECEDVAPPETFEAAVEWHFEGEGDFHGATTTPLVANLTDDNGDGTIDLCDTPDIVTVVFNITATEAWDSRIFVVDGATGEKHFMIDESVAGGSTPAIGDIDGDGIPEIVAVEPAFAGPDYHQVAHVVAFEHDGTLAWRSDLPARASDVDAVALADVDADGDVEIIMKTALFDHTGHLLWSHPEPSDFWDTSSAADLDGDGMLEIVAGAVAFRHDGSPYYSLPLDEHGFRETGFAQVADIDGDGDPEVTFNTYLGLTVIEHDGTISTSQQRTDIAEQRPGVMADIDGDGRAEFTVGHRATLTLLEAAMDPMWTVTATDNSCCAGPAAFDFLGSGAPQLVFAGDFALTVFDAHGATLGTFEHGSGTGNETPVIADVDNDGSAEIVFVSNGYDFDGNLRPTVTVLGDPEDRWLQARRIWNQHTYHVTNVREDGTIPQHEPPHWETLNTFRTQAAISNGMPCESEPEG